MKSALPPRLLLLAVAGMTGVLPAHAAYVVTPDSVPAQDQYEAASRALPPGVRGAVFRSGEVDINGDDRADFIGQFTDRCTPAGCEAFLLLATPTGYAARVIPLPVFDTRVTVLDTLHRGMRDLRFDDSRYVYRWDGQAYR